MLKRYSILTLLLFAYTIVLAHNIIPHHHKHDAQVTEQAHHHDHDDQDHDDENPGLLHDFENYIHSGDIVELQKPHSEVSASSEATAYIIIAFTFQIKTVECPPPIYQASKDHRFTSQHCLYSKGLRAPPLA